MVGKQSSGKQSSAKLGWMCRFQGRILIWLAPHLAQNPTSNISLANLTGDFSRRLRGEAEMKLNM